MFRILEIFDQNTLPEIRKEFRANLLHGFGFLPEDNRDGTGSIYGVWKKEFVVRVCHCGFLNGMANLGVICSTSLVLLLLELCVVSCDLTDGNTEHLKREHSLMKPYQGELARLAR